MATKDLQTLNLKFDQAMFNSLVFTWERNFEMVFGIFSVSQINSKHQFKLSFQRKNEAAKHNLVKFKAPCLKVFCFYGQQIYHLAFNSIFTTTLEVF